MITTRSQYPLLQDEKAKLHFKRLTHCPDIPKEYWRTSWSELHELRSKITKGIQHILDVAEKEKRTIEEDETQGYNYGMECLEALDEEFEIRASHNTKDPVNLSNGHKFHGHSRDGKYSSDGYFMADMPKGTGKEYRNLFYPETPHISLSTDGFRNIAEFFQAVAGQQKDSRLREARAETRVSVVGEGVYGGFAVPEGFTEILMDRALLAEEIFRPRALVMPMTAGSVNVPVFDTLNRSDGTLMGIELKFYAENGTLDVQTPKLTNDLLVAKKSAIHWEESRELIQDGPAFHAKLVSLLPRVIAQGLDKYFLTGTGVSQPLGVLESDSVVTVTRNTASSILYADIKQLWGSLHPSCHMNACWIINSASIPQLLGLKDTNNNNIWHPGMNGSVKDGVPQTLFGRPVLYCENAPALGTTGDITLCDLSQYVIGMRQEMILETSNAPGWSRDVVSFRITMRFNAQPIWKSVITMPDSSELSWAAVLS